MGSSCDLSHWSVQIRVIKVEVTSAKIALLYRGLQLFFHCILILNHRCRSRFLVNVEYEKCKSVSPGAKDKATASLYFGYR